jgi:hypothetical protein
MRFQIYYRWDMAMLLTVEECSGAKGRNMLEKQADKLAFVGSCGVKRYNGGGQYQSQLHVKSLILKHPTIICRVRILGCFWYSFDFAQCPLKIHHVTIICRILQLRAMNSRSTRPKPSQAKQVPLLSELSLVEGQLLSLENISINTSTLSWS